MYRTEQEALNSITYTYHISGLTKERMLEHIYTILEDDDIRNHGVIITEPTPSEEWSGMPIELPELPVREVFEEMYKKLDFTGMTAIMEYHGKTIMLLYRPEQEEISVIIPKEIRVSIDEIEKNVIPDEIDENPEN